jgi:hypothetical protein
MLNGIRLNKEAPLKEAVSVFTSDVKLLFKSIDKVKKHKSMILRRQLKTLKLPKNASLLMLTKASFLIDRKQAKAEALLSIISYTLKIPIEEVAKLLLKIDTKVG